jgi:hypothetical protein
MYIYGIKRFDMVQPAQFIRLEVTDKHGNVQIKFVNMNHIQIVYQKENDVIVELADYTELKICNQNILIFMDRFK